MVKKQSTKHHPPETKPVEVGHLEEKLTQITRSTAERIKRWRVPLIALVLLVLVAQGSFSLVNRLREGKEKYYNQEVYELFQGPASRIEGYKPDRERVRKLLEDVKGHPSERFISRAVVQYYLDRAAGKSQTSFPVFGGMEGPRFAPGGLAGGNAPADAREAREEAMRIAADVAARHPNDTEIQLWASSVKAAIDAEVAQSWLEDRRKYRPPEISPGRSAEDTLGRSGPDPETPPGRSAPDPKGRSAPDPGEIPPGRSAPDPGEIPPGRSAPDPEKSTPGAAEPRSP